MDTPTGAFIKTANARKDLYNTALRQLIAANGNNIQWYISDKATYNAIKLFFQEISMNQIELYFSPME
jgi:methionine salvage enolase-phosphatase E1